MKKKKIRERRECSLFLISSERSHLSWHLGFFISRDHRERAATRLCLSSASLPSLGVYLFVVWIRGSSISSVFSFFVHVHLLDVPKNKDLLWCSCSLPPQFFFRSSLLFHFVPHLSVPASWVIRGLGSPELPRGTHVFYLVPRLLE